MNIRALGYITKFSAEVHWTVLVVNFKRIPKEKGNDRKKCTTLITNIYFISKSNLDMFVS